MTACEAATISAQLRPGDDDSRIDALLKANPLDFWKDQLPHGWHWEHSWKQGCTFMQCSPAAFFAVSARKLTVSGYFN